MITQYQTSVSINEELLSEEQIELRINSKKEEEGEIKRCKKCAIQKPLNCFRLRTVRHGKVGIFYDASCKDCHARTRGTIEIGKNKFSKHILAKGLKRCSKCTNIKPISDFYTNKGHYTGMANNCKQCNYEKKTKSLI